MNRKALSLFVMGLMLFSVFFVAKPAAAYNEDELVKYGLEALQPKYYTTPQKLDGILDMTEDTLTMLTSRFQISPELVKKNIGIEYKGPTMEVTNQDQFWDLAKIAMGLGIYESARVFLIEQWEYYPVNKKRVTYIKADPNVGIGTRWNILTAKTPDKVLRIAQFASTGGLFMSAWNPVGGLNDVYSTRVWGLIRDYGGATNFEGVYSPYRCTWKLEKGNFKVPKDAVIYNQTQGWISAHAGENASVKVTITCDVGEWHNGAKGGIEDIKNYIAFYYIWAYQDKPGDKYFDPSFSGAATSLSLIKGFEFTDNGYVVYGTYKHPFADDVTAGFYVFYPSLPWELYYAMGELVANKDAYGIGTTYSFFKAKGAEWIDLLTKAHDEDLKKILGYAAQNGKFKTDFPGLEMGDLKERAKADIDFYDKYHHLSISNGPYVLIKYDPDVPLLELHKFNGPRKVYTDTLPKDGYAEKIYYQGVQNPETTILSIAKGDFDLGMFAFPAGKYRGLDKSVLDNLNLYKSASGYNELTFNTWHDPDKDAPIVTVQNKTYFNPFAVREVRFAMNWLISRQYIVQTIYKGSGKPMFGCIRPSHPANKYFEPVYAAMGLTPDGDIDYALQLFNEGMKKAQEQVAKYGHKLEKKGNIWYFDGQPVTVKFIIRTEDERKDIGLYVASLIEKNFGFKVEKLLYQRDKASPIVFGGSPSTYQWNIYTGGWGAGGLPSKYVDGYFSFFYTNWDGYLPNGGGINDGHRNTATVKQLLTYIGSINAPPEQTATPTETPTKTSTPTKTQTPTPTSSTAKKKGGICGPAFIVGLAIVPLLLRRRK